MPTADKISIIIPALNEARTIVEHLRATNALRGFHEVILADGGSSDDTVKQARGVAGVRVTETARGRAVQMNAGAEIAEGNVYLFLHADVRLPTDAATHLRSALADPEVVAGAFRTWTVSDPPGSWLGALLHLADIRSRYTRLPYGDQALFVRRELFNDLGGFPELPLMEDLELSRRLRRRGRIARLRARVRVSGRRFQAHPIRDTLLVNIYPFLYRLGVSPERLARFYAQIR